MVNENKMKKKGDEAFIYAYKNNV